jgi:glyoxylase-like metal-dependent hydrolase (beta-lactamase superfamily II)
MRMYPVKIAARLTIALAGMISLAAHAVEPDTPKKGDAPTSVTARPAARLTVLVDNTSARPDMQAIWGFACLVEARGHTVLLDTGADPKVLKHNLAAMKVDPAKIEAVVISHYHYDHTLGAPGLGML